MALMLPSYTQLLEIIKVDIYNVNHMACKLPQ